MKDVSDNQLYVVPPQVLCLQAVAFGNFICKFSYYDEHVNTKL